MAAAAICSRGRPALSHRQAARRDLRARPLGVTIRSTILRSLTITGEQIRAARALARVGQAELARACGLSVETIKRLERTRGPVGAHVRTLAALLHALAGLGVQIEAGGGVVPSTPRHEPQRPGPADLRRIIYRGRLELSRIGSMRATLNDIERQCRERNVAAGATGALLVREGCVLGILEAPSERARALLDDIATDLRHQDLAILEDRAVASRQFLDWALCCGVFPSDPPLAGEKETLTPLAALGVLKLAHELQHEPPRTARRVIASCALAALCQDATCAARAPGEDRSAA